MSTGIDGGDIFLIQNTISIKQFNGHLTIGEMMIKILDKSRLHHCTEERIQSFVRKNTHTNISSMSH